VSYHIGERLPDGREVLVDHRVEPAATIMHRIHKAKLNGKAPADADYEALGAWLDQHPDEACTHATISAGCHGLAPEPGGGE